MSETPVFTVTATSLTFLWDSCRRCFWLTHRAKFKRPSGAFPRVFSLIDAAMKDYFADKRTEEFAGSSLPSGRIAFGGRRVKSAGIVLDGHAGMLVISGAIDSALNFDEGGFGIVDYKVTTPKPEHVPFYWRQLNAYALASEHPARGSLRLEPVSHLGLLCLEPVGMSGTGRELALECDATFHEVERDDDAFEAFLEQVLTLLEQESPPEPASDCDYCRYIAVGSLMLTTELFEGGG